VYYAGTQLFRTSLPNIKIYHDIKFISYYSAKELSSLQKGGTVQIFRSNPNQTNSFHEENYERVD